MKTLPLLIGCVLLAGPLLAADDLVGTWTLQRRSSGCRRSSARSSRQALN
jgi:hypothetical protein